jgi:hypothetical protein
MSLPSTSSSLCKAVRLMLTESDESRHWRQVLDQARRESAAHDRDLRQMYAWRQAQDEICRNLIDGRISLTRASRRLLELPSRPAYFWDMLRQNVPGATDDERLANYIIDRACLVAEPAQAQALRHRLESELRDRPGDPASSSN